MKKNYFMTPKISLTNRITIDPMNNIGPTIEIKATPINHSNTIYRGGINFLNEKFKKRKSKFEVEIENLKKKKGPDFSLEPEHTVKPDNPLTDPDYHHGYDITKDLTDNQLMKFIIYKYSNEGWGHKLTEAEKLTFITIKKQMKKYTSLNNIIDKNILYPYASPEKRLELLKEFRYKLIHHINPDFVINEQLNIEAKYFKDWNLNNIIDYYINPNYNNKTLFPNGVPENYQINNPTLNRTSSFGPIQIQNIGIPILGYNPFNILDDEQIDWEDEHEDIYNIDIETIKQHKYEKGYNNKLDWETELLNKKRQEEKEHELEEYFEQEKYKKGFKSNWLELTREEKETLETLKKQKKSIDYDFDFKHTILNNELKFKTIKVKKLRYFYDKYNVWSFQIPLYNLYLEWYSSYENKTYIGKRLYIWEETEELIKYNPKTGRFDSFVNPELNRYKNFIIYDKSGETILEFNHTVHEKQRVNITEGDDDIYDPYDYEEVKQRIKKGYSFGGSLNILRKAWWYSSSFIDKIIKYILKPVKWTFNVFGLFPNNPITNFVGTILNDISEQVRLSILAFSMGIEYIIHITTKIIVFILKIPKHFINTITFIFKHKGLISWSSTLIGLISTMYGYSYGYDPALIWGELLLRYGTVVDFLINIIYDIFGRGRSVLDVIRNYGLQNVLIQIIIRITVLLSLYRWQHHSWNEVIVDPDPRNRQGVNNYIGGRAIQNIRYFFRWINPANYFLNFIPGFGNFNLGDWYSNHLRNNILYNFQDRSQNHQYLNLDRYNTILNDPRLQRIDNIANNNINRKTFESNIGKLPDAPDLGGNINAENINIDYFERLISGAAGGLKHNKNWKPEKVNIEGTVSLSNINEMAYRAFLNLQKKRNAFSAERIKNRAGDMVNRLRYKVNLNRSPKQFKHKFFDMKNYEEGFGYNPDNHM